MRYPRSRPGNEHASSLGQPIAHLEKLGLTDTIADVLGHMKRSSELRRMIKQGAPQLTEQRNEIARQLARGDIDASAAGFAGSDIVRTVAAHEERIEMLKLAYRFADAWASNALADHGDRLITDVLGPEVEKCVKTVAKAAEVVPDDLTDELAARSEKRIRDAWFEMSEATDRFSLLCTAAESLRLRGYCPVPPEIGDMPRILFEYVRPDLVARLWDKSIAAPHRLASDIAAGAEPRLRTGAEVAEEVAAERAEDALNAKRKRVADRPNATLPNRERVRDAAREAVEHEERRNPVVQFIPDPGGAA